MKKANKKVIIIAVAALVLVAGIVAGIIALTTGNASVPGKKNEDEVNATPDSITLIEKGDEVKKEDVTAITAATKPDGTVVDNKGIKDKAGHIIYDTGEKDAAGNPIYTTGKLDSKGNVLYTKNQVNSFGQLIYYSGNYVDGKLVLSATVEKPDYTSNEKPNPYKPQEQTTTVTVPLKEESSVKITGMKRDYIQFLGGRGMDNMLAVSQCKDGGYVATVYSNSYDADFADASKDWAGHGSVVKYDADGKVLWTYRVGGDSEIMLNDVVELKDGTVVAVGCTLSSEAEPKKTSKSHSAIIIRLKANGDHMWTYVFPGSEEFTGEFIQSVAATPDGGFVVGGKAESNAGFFKGEGQARKAFLFKFDKNCNLKWRRILSGSMSNNIAAVDVNKNGDIFATCVTVSNDGDFAGILYPAKAGAYNTVLMKLNKNGDLEWKKYLQGSGNSQYEAVCATDDGGCVVAGSFNVNKRADGIYSMTYGKSDGYVIRYNKDGDVNWGRVVGGAGADYINAITKIDGGFVIVGKTDSTNGDFSGEIIGGKADGFIMYLNEKGETSAQLVLDGKNEDLGKSVCTLADGTVVVAGSTASKDGFFHGSKADNQFNCFVAKFTADKE
ncbi:MAG: hypothetical protein IIX16_00910 [Clostridia bacterium]|nr:hypothetical protein [Clostridia bacterium]